MSAPEVGPAQLRAAAKLYSQRAGWKVFPVYGIVAGKCACSMGHMSPKDGGKHPVPNSGHKDATTDQDVIDAYWPPVEAGGSSMHNVGVPCAANGLLVVDVDPRNGGNESWDKLVTALGGMPETLTAFTGNWGGQRGRHYYFRVPEGATFHGTLPDYPGLDFKHQGYVLAAPSKHISGVTYEWAVRGGPLTVPPAVMPEGLLKLVLKGRKGGSGSAADTYGVLSWGGKKIDVDELIRTGIPEGSRIDTLYPIMCALANQYPVAQSHGAGAFKAVVRVINNRGCRPPLPDDELDFQMKRAIDFVVENPKERMVEREIGADVLGWVAAQRATAESEAASSGGVVTPPEDPDDLLRIAAGLGGPRSDDGSAGSGGASGGTGGVVTGPGGPGGGSPLPPDIDELDVPHDKPFLPRSLTDMGNARRLAEHYRGTIKYTEGMGWFVWDEPSRRWINDWGGELATDKATALPGLVARELLIYDATTDHGKAIAKWSTDSRSTARLEAAKRQWRTRSWVRTPVDAWDSHRDLLGVKNGVVNLRTGELLEGDPALGITKRTEVAYEKGMRAVQWEQFLEFATGGDKELQSWLQLAAGYTLTGRNDYDVFFIVYGQPGSGKSTFLEALAHVLGEQYSISLPVAALIDDGRGGSQDEYYRAQLPGKRLALFSEWPSGKKTKEDAIKQLTGDLTMTGRHPGGQPFSFQSQTKLWLGTNVLPAINDQAMWRRIRAVHFPHVPEKPNPELKTWLSDPEGGLPAVMSWCVEGAVRLLNSGQRDALGWCKAVADASAEYRAQEDRMGQFLEEETAEEAGRTVPVVSLFEVYQQWAEDRGERPMTRLPFEKALLERGHKITGKGRHGMVEGRSLRPRTVSHEGTGTVDIGALAERYSR